MSIIDIFIRQRPITLHQSLKMQKIHLSKVTEAVIAVDESYLLNKTSKVSCLASSKGTDNLLCIMIKTNFV